MAVQPASIKQVSFLDSHELLADWHPQLAALVASLSWLLWLLWSHWRGHDFMFNHWGQSPLLICFSKTFFCSMNSFKLYNWFFPSKVWRPKTREAILLGSVCCLWACLTFCLCNEQRILNLGEIQVVWAPPSLPEQPNLITENSIRRIIVKLSGQNYSLFQSLSQNFQRPKLSVPAQVLQNTHVKCHIIQVETYSVGANSDLLVNVLLSVWGEKYLFSICAKNI